MNAFERFEPRLQDAIVSRLGWSSLRPVQEFAAHALLDGNNAVILAPTAGGKTEAAIFPMLTQLMKNEPENVGLIYIAPIKALLNNQSGRIGEYAEMVGLKCFMWHGDVKQSQKNKFLKAPTDLLLTTPESLEVMLLSPRVPHLNLFKDFRVVIVDEVHALAGTDRGAHLMSVLERLVQNTKNDVQRIGLSATVGNPDYILSWLQGSSKRKGQVVDPPKIKSKKNIKIYLPETINGIALEASKQAYGKKSLFFCQSRSLAEKIAEQMQGGGTDVFVHHSSVSHEERKAAEDRFHHGSNTSIVCTSTLELGIDVGDLDLVLQANAPSTVSSFLQRLGRTGRRPGQISNTTFFCEEFEAVLQAVAIVELAKEHWVESAPQNNRCWPVLVHQVFALALQFGAISDERCWAALHIVPDLSGIIKPEFDALLDHLIENDFLFKSGGLLSLGDETERIFGRKNFMELYAVFTSPQLYKVKTNTGYVLGSLEQMFVDKLVAEMSSFLLSGRAWTVVHINHSDRTVRVEPAPRGKRPSWGGIVPQILGFVICQKAKEVIASDDEISYIDDRSRNSLKDIREDLGPLLKRSGINLQMEPERALWWTFAGGQINHTLKYGIEIQCDFKVIADNFKLKIESNGSSFEPLEKMIRNLSKKDYWEDSETVKLILQKLPEYRLSKFQQALPKQYAMEMISNMLLDVAGTIKFLIKLKC
ncbi:MAG: DEAD/DEAH box helicase [Desulfobacteraceae bacterium]|nr:MAG: DEAD/DEAH box helicase [Desulfobacteraceae bacterium]